MDKSVGLRVFSVPQPPQGPEVTVKFDHQDSLDNPDADQRTSLRFFTEDERTLLPQPHFPLDPGPYFSPRDRDLGQSFVAPAGPSFRLAALTLRVGPARMAVGSGAPDAPVSLQFFSVTGTPTIRDVSGTPVPHGSHPSRDMRADYITGESYEPLWLVSGGVLPHDLEPLRWLRWEFPADGPVLQAGRRYAFLVMFDQPAHGRELALANKYHGPQEFGGHGIRREGSVAQPWADHSWVNNLKASSLPIDLEQRLAQPPGTWGRPDVDTYRVLRFYVEGV
jgi:hypothetical protein